MAYDDAGKWAASGDCDDALLGHMLTDAYFDRTPPKSTGLEYFNEHWLASQGVDDLDHADVQATLCELTARSVAAAIKDYAAGTQEVLVCGGGAHNVELMQRLSGNLPGVLLDSTAEYGLDPDWVEACAFAWLAMRALDNLPGNAPGATGASRPAVLGAIHPAG
jgi:anhydro-N-acetylmuramic acid kinase